ncbi:MAG: hypothetical protein HC925_06450 [Coleofasciculaceae cyanobacterium SM2_3_26]|nr:hypothetical protein [Coleofasciculaceae cyanobacterium SM2_3_26]
MTPDTLVQIFQQGFHITLGATASLVESLQSDEKREENLAQLQSDWGELSKKLAEKGEVTEQEARSFVDNLLNQSPSQPNGDSDVAGGSVPSQMPTIPSRTALQQEVQDLAKVVAGLRAELEASRDRASQA